jgi:excisionase family DNA binding protein
MADRPLTYQEAASRLGVTVRWLEDAVQNNRVAHHRMGRLVRFTESDLEDILRAARRVPPGSSRSRRKAS